MSFNKEKSLKAAEKYIQQGKIVAAIDEYRKIAYADPYDLTILNTLGDLCARAGKTDEATLNFLRVAENYRDTGHVNAAIAVYKKILKMDPSNAEIALTLADLYVKQKLLVDARQQYQAVADLYRRNGQTRQALRAMEKIADIDPENAVLRFELAAGYHQEGLNDEAFEFYLQAGKEFFRKGRDTESVQAFQKALSIKSDSKPALKSLVEALIRQGEIRTALSMLDYLMKRSPEDMDLIVLLGRTYLNARMLESAEAAFAHLLNQDKSRYDYMLEVGRAYIENKQFDRALTVLDRCMEILFEQKQKKKATAYLRTILKADPQHLPTLKQLANIYARMREKKNLVATLNAIVEVALQKGLQDEASYALQQLMEAEPKEATQKDPAEATEKAEATSESSISLSASSFPPGFEASSALSQWQRSLSGGESSTNPFAVPQTPSKPATPSESVSSNEEISSEYSTELLEQMVKKTPEFHQARLKLLEDMVAQSPEHIEARVKLKQFYLDAGLKEKAAVQCMEIARLYEIKGKNDLAKQALTEGYDLDPTMVERMSAHEPVRIEYQPVPPPEWETQSWTEEKHVEETNIEVMLTLMGLSSRSFFDKFLTREWRRAARSVTSLTVLLIDLDFFKAFREATSNQGGDDCLKQVAHALHDELKRPGDLLAYNDRDQFIVLLPETPREGALIVGEKMRTRIEALNIPHPRSPKGKVTVSIGIASTIPQAKASEGAFVAAAELALYQAQRAGCDRVVVGQTIV